MLTSERPRPGDGVTVGLTGHERVCVRVDAGRSAALRVQIEDGFDKKSAGITPAQLRSFCLQGLALADKVEKPEGPPWPHCQLCDRPVTCGMCANFDPRHFCPVKDLRVNEDSEDAALCDRLERKGRDDE